jgi:hypothetical protein
MDIGTLLIIIIGLLFFIGIVLLSYGTKRQ